MSVLPDVLTLIKNSITQRKKNLVFQIVLVFYDGFKDFKYIKPICRYTRMCHLLLISSIGMLNLHSEHTCHHGSCVEWLQSYNQPRLMGNKLGTMNYPLNQTRYAEEERKSPSRAMKAGVEQCWAETTEESKQPYCLQRKEQTAWLSMSAAQHSSSSTSPAFIYEQIKISKPSRLIL